MKPRLLILTIALCLTAATALAAEKSAAQTRLDSARSALEALAGTIADNRDAALDLEQGRAALKKGAEAAEKGKQLFGFGAMKPEAELDIKRYAEIAELSTTAAAARIEKSRAAAELALLDQQLESVKAKVKKFEDRQAELEKFKTQAAKCQTAVSELEALKAENSRLSTQLDKQQAEIKALSTQLEQTKNEGVCRETVEPPAPPKSEAAPAQPAVVAPVAPAAPATPAAPAAGVPEPAPAAPVAIPDPSPPNEHP